MTLSLVEDQKVWEKISKLLKMLGDVNPKRGFKFPHQPPPPKPMNCSFDCSAVLMPTIYNGEELGLVSKGLGVESGLRCLTHCGALRKSFIPPLTC